MRVVFMGSPDFAVPSLEALIEARFEVRLVVTQPDRPAGRGRHVLPTAVKQVALEHHFPVREFGRAKRRGHRGSAGLRSRGRRRGWPSVTSCANRCCRLRRSVASTCTPACLPRWRGVSPVQYSILHGDTWTGVTIMRMDAGVDTGPILAQRGVPIGPEDTAGELLDSPGRAGRRPAGATRCASWRGGQVTPEPQDDAGAVYAPKLTRGLVGRALGPGRGHGAQPDPRLAAPARRHDLPRASRC